jgi:hypothetical protein
MPAREIYQRKARNCAAVAETMRAPAERAAMLSIARDYLTLADHVGARHDQCRSKAKWEGQSLLTLVVREPHWP